MRGVIYKIFPNRGFAFVRGEDNVSRFAHCREFAPPVSFDMAKERTVVEFEPYTDHRGERAKDVRIVAQ